jgi:hypothetical protein
MDIQVSVRVDKAAKLPQSGPELYPTLEGEQANSRENT